ncbi:hypothetical protein EHO61_13605 [Leptospira fluminis]|uniref:Uncharacterized protein n=1 Tax=Leptospira fluminis TaxID=2484979 RepID=A0A4R9GMG9_9LEPT|nr:hypothetical protein EHO61_13605 [Leptospira fluminis]
MRRALYILLVLVQVALVLFSSSIDLIDQGEASRISSVALKKGSPVVFLESDLTGSDPLFFAPARERDSRPVELLSEGPSFFPWIPPVFLSGHFFSHEKTWAKNIVSFLLTSLPPPALS